MNSALLNEIVNAVLYEGYILYPYRASSSKNQRERFTFGRVYPGWYSEEQGGAEPCVMQTECLLEGEAGDIAVEVVVRLLQPRWREVGVLQGQGSAWDGASKPAFMVLPELRVGEKVHQTWQEATEREVKVQIAGNGSSKLQSPNSNEVPNPSLQPGRETRAHSAKAGERAEFRFQEEETWQPIRDEQGRNVGVLLRRSEAIEGEVAVDVRPIQRRLHKITVRVANFSSRVEQQGEHEDRSGVLMTTFTSTHAVLTASAGAKFVSLLDPPEKWKKAAADCANIGTWPVLVGDESKGERDTMLSSPIILYDYPQIAPESRGNFFDSTEIDEML